MSKSKRITDLTLDELDCEIDHIVNLELNGGGYGCPEAREAYERKLRILMSLREQKLAKNQIENSSMNQPDSPKIIHRNISNLDEAFGYVSATRIKELKAIKSERVDLTKLIRLCEELNIAHANGLNLAMAMLLRAILDHVPPVFSKASFKEVASGCGGKSFKDTMKHLQDGARKIADSHLHIQVRRTEVLPTYLQVNFSPYLDVLLAEVVAILQSEAA